MRLLFWGTYDTGKPRQRILIQGLTAHGIDVDHCHADVWSRIEDKSQMRGFIPKLLVLVRWLASYPFLIYRFLRAPKPDAVIIGYPGIVDVIVLAPFARLRRVPIVWDMFMSIYDTVVLDRRLLRHKSTLAKLLFRLERLSLRHAASVFLDTAAHARRIEALYGLKDLSCGSVWVGAEDNFFAHSAPAAAPRGIRLKVLFYGQFIPLHGVETIVAAAQSMQSDPIEWLLIGRGQVASRVGELIRETPIPHLTWLEWANYEQLKAHIAAADVCLGIFGASEKAASVIPNKVFQVVAARKPIITRDSPAIRELLTDSPPCSRLIPAQDAQALAEALRAFMSKAPEQIGMCHANTCSLIDATAIGSQLVALLSDHLGRERPLA